MNAADRVFRDSSKDRQPYLEGIFQPQTIHPSSLFTPANSWRFQLQLAVPILYSLDGAERRTLQQTLDRSVEALARVARRQDPRLARLPARPDLGLLRAELLAARRELPALVQHAGQRGDPVGRRFSLENALEAPHLPLEPRNLDFEG